MIWINIVAAFLIACVSSLFFFKVITRKLKSKKIFRLDTNKYSKERKVPALGGIAAFMGFIFTITVMMGVFAIFDKNVIDTNILMFGLLTVTLLALLGMVDDILEFTRKRTKPLMAIFATIPLVAANYTKQTIVNVPFIGNVEFGILYALVIIPIIIVFCSNAVNILAGLDGLVPGMGAIATLGLLIISYMKFNTTAVLFLTTLLAVQMTLYKYNRYPSRILPGNIGTLFIGGAIAVGAIIGNIERALVIVMVPYGLHFLLYIRTWFKFTPKAMGDYTTKKGVLKTRAKKSYGLTIFLMKHFKNMTEKSIVYYLIGVETLFSILAIASYLIFP